MDSRINNGSLSPDKFRIILINDNLLIVARVRIGSTLF